MKTNFVIVRGFFEKIEILLKNLVIVRGLSEKKEILVRIRSSPLSDKWSLMLKNRYFEH